MIYKKYNEFINENMLDTTFNIENSLSYLISSVKSNNNIEQSFLQFIINLDKFVSYNKNNNPEYYMTNLLYRTDKNALKYLYNYIKNNYDIVIEITNNYSNQKNMEFIINQIEQIFNIKDSIVSYYNNIANEYMEKKYDIDIFIADYMKSKDKLLFIELNNDTLNQMYKFFNSELKFEISNEFKNVINYMYRLSGYFLKNYIDIYKPYFKFELNNYKIVNNNNFGSELKYQNVKNSNLKLINEFINLIKTKDVSIREFIQNNKSFLQVGIPISYWYYIIYKNQISNGDLNFLKLYGGSIISHLI